MIKVLLVDDDMEYNNSLKQCLEYAGYQVVTAFDGKQGCDLFYEETPDVLLTDIIMPEQDGYELILKLGSLSDTSEVVFPCKVIAMSGGGRITGENYLNNAEALGVDAVIKKPFSFGELDRTIKELMKNTQTD